MSPNAHLAAVVTTAVLIAGAGGYGLAKLTGEEPKAVPAKSEPEAPPPAPGVVTLKSEAIQTAQIGVETVAAGGFAAEISAQGSVTSAPGGEAVLTARASGAVIRLGKRLGDPVRAGETLAVVESREAAQMTADRAAATARAGLAEKTLAREKYLFEQKVSPRQDYERAQAEAEAAAAEVRRAAAAAGAARVTADGRGVLVTSPISGRITAAPVSLGAYVQPETELYRVADPRQIQVEVLVAGADAQRVNPGDRAVVETADGGTWATVVRSVTPGLSMETRAATVVVSAPQGAVGLAPGHAVRVRLYPRQAAGQTAIVVAEEAVQTLDGREVVFVRTATGFAARPVTTGRRSAGRIEIISGIAAGQVIASRNAFLLKAELAKGEGEED